MDDHDSTKINGGKNFVISGQSRYFLSCVTFSEQFSMSFSVRNGYIYLTVEVSTVLMIIVSL
jgi:hypothetical protein